MSESIVAVENGPCCAACRPKVTSAIRSEAGFEATKAVAAAAASASGLPAIDRDVSRARTTFFDRPRFVALRPTTGRPFSSSFGATADGTEVRTVAPTAG